MKLRNLRPTYLLVSAVVVIVVAVALFSTSLNDRFRPLCELKGHLWIQPSHGEPYCGDGTGNPPDRDAPKQRR